MLHAHLSYRRPLAPRGQELGVNPAQDLMGYTQMRSSLTGPSHCAEPSGSGPLSGCGAAPDLAARAGASILRTLLALDCEVLLASSFPICRL